MAISVNKENEEKKQEKKEANTTLSQIDSIININYEEMKYKRNLLVEKYQSELNDQIDRHEKGKLDINQSIMFLLKSKEKQGAKKYRTPGDGLISNTQSPDNSNKVSNELLNGKNTEFQLNMQKTPHESNENP